MLDEENSEQQREPRRGMVSSGSATHLHFWLVYGFILIHIEDRKWSKMGGREWDVYRLLHR